MAALPVAVLAALTQAAPAHAACAALPDLPRLEDYDSVFAGTVVRTTGGGAAAEVVVRDVWHGPDLPPRVVVVGGQLEAGVSSSVDRTFSRGDLAFFTYRADDGSLRDSACSPTAALPRWAALDPPGVRAPDPDADRPTDPRPLTGRLGLPGPAALAVALTAALAGALALMGRAAR